MSVPKFDSSEEEIKKWLNQIALICLSEEFKKLKQELENIYRQCGMEEDAVLAAFQDALYAFLAERDDRQACQSEVF